MELIAGENVSSRRIGYVFLLHPISLVNLFVFGIRFLYILISIFLIRPTGRLKTIWQEFSEFNIDISIFDCYRSIAYR